MKIEVIKDKEHIKALANIHIKSFKGFFLTFLGEGFLRTLYKGFISHEKSDVIGAFDDDGKLLGFVAYSENISAFYKYLIKKYLFQFGFYAGIAFLKKPKIMFRLLRAFTYSKESKREENYMELSSICVLPECEGMGIGSKLIAEVVKRTDFEKFDYIKLETDAVDNDGANAFYVKNGFELADTYSTAEGRKMNEYHWREKVETAVHS